MAGLPKSYAKHGFKKGWAMFKKDNAGKTRKRKSSSSPKRKRSYSKASPEISGINFPQVVRRARRKLSGSKTDKILAGVGNIGFDIALLVLGMIGASQIKKMSPMKNMFAMNLLTFGAGSVGAVLAKKNYIRIPMMGIAASAFISQVKATFPKLPISGDEDFVYLPNMQGEEIPQVEYMGDIRGEVVEGESVEGEEEGVYGADDEGVYGSDDYVYGESDEMMG
jgi:hypothetical protein